MPEVIGLPWPVIPIEPKTTLLYEFARKVFVFVIEASPLPGGLPSEKAKPLLIRKGGAEGVRRNGKEQLKQQKNAKSLVG